MTEREVTLWLERSVLSVPGSNWRMIEKAVGSDADVAFIDLEDAVAPDLKASSRENVVRALHELDWGSKSPAYRVNALDTPYFYRDLIEVVEEAGDALALVIVPKVDRPEDLVTVDTLLGQLELAMDLEPGGIGIEAQIESAQGLVNVERIAQASPRLQSLVFGPGDYAATMHMPMENIGAAGVWDREYGSHRFHYPMSRIAAAAHANGLRVLDGPVATFRDLDGFRRSCLTARALGYAGKWCIHPSQIPIANEVFSPSEEEVRWATQVMDAYLAATAAGQGAISVDGKMIDMASIRLAEMTMTLARAAGLL